LAFIEGIGYATEVLSIIYLFLQKQLVFKIDENGLEKTLNYPT
jgi:hypothetical protein